ncbi:hypothetical protein L7F22_027558 [Adiantum nelumboides]|nr:hypothetical protein [Adiantum nelumboides]
MSTIGDTNERLSRSGKTVDSKPISIRNKGNTGSPTSASKDQEHQDEKISCNVHDIWLLLSTLQETVLKQNNDIKDLALQNQDLQHKMQLQDIKVQEQDKKIGMLEAQLESLNTATQTQLSTLDEKLKDMTSWAHVVETEVTNTPTCTTRTNVTEHVIKTVDMAEHNDRTKRSMNISLRGLPEPENETILTLNANMSDFFGDHSGMPDVVVYGAHRVGKKKTEGHRAVVCTLLDARKRSIILENARFYLKNSPYHVKEDYTPAQQEERRRAYEESKKKEDTPSDA